MRRARAAGQLVAWAALALIDVFYVNHRRALAGFGLGLGAPPSTTGQLAVGLSSPWWRPGNSSPGGRLRHLALGAPARRGDPLLARDLGRRANSR
jgi:hypothetical protein